MHDNSLRTARLLLRRAKLSDLQDLHAVLSNAEAMRYWSTPPHATLPERGFATECLSAIIHRIFARTTLDSVTADVDPRNIASLRVLGKLGFVETHRATATLMVGDVWCDSIYLALSRRTHRGP